MSGWGLWQWIALGAAAITVVLLMLVPRTPPGKAEAKLDAVDMKVAQAVALVNGAEPMKGIMMLREVTEQHPDNVEAQFHLGLFSVQTQQFDKALERFRTVTRLAGDDIPDAWFYLGRAYATVDSIPQAIAALEHYMTLAQDTVILNGVAGFINELQLENSEEDALR